MHSQHLVKNRILRQLSADELKSVEPWLTLVQLQLNVVLHEQGGPIEHIYFPLSGMASLLAVMQSGEAIETGIVGADGLLGGDAMGRAQWPATYHHLAVGAVCRDNRFRLDAVPTDGIAQHCKGRTCRRGRLPGIDLLERDDIGLMARDRLHYAGQIEVTVGTDATVNVPCHHANGSASAFQVLRLLQRSSRACAPIETVSQASTAKVKSNMLVSVGSLTMLQSWWPSADIKIRPGAMPMIVPNR